MKTYHIVGLVWCVNSAMLPAEEHFYAVQDGLSPSVQQAVFRAEILLDADEFLS